MPRSSDLLARIQARDTRTLVRLGLGALLALNLALFALVLYPPGGSAGDLEAQLQALRSQLQRKRLQLDRTRALAAKVEKGREQGDQFVEQYFLNQRLAYSQVLADLNAAARQSQIKPREASFELLPIEGSDTLSMMTITANFEGTYADLMHFVRILDRADRLVIVESLQASPQQGRPVLDVRMKLDTFVREDGGALPLAGGQ
jgi:Tfp pilus assembly protein PilO